MVGGVESVIFNLANSFRYSGHYVEVIETQGKGEWCDYFRKENVHVLTFSFNLATIPALHVRRITRRLQSFDCVLINDAPYAQAGIGLLKKTIKVFPTLHLGVPSMIQTALASMGQWNKIICISPQLKSLLDIEISEGLSVFIPNGIEPVGWVERDYEKIIRILYVGRIEDSQKGIFLLPKIIASLKQIRTDFKLVIIGNGPSMSDLKRMIVDYNIADRVCLRSSLPHDQVIQAMKENHFLIMPSYYEGMPIVMLEAMSSGLIPIASKLHGHTDMLVKEGITGFYGLPGNADSFVAAIVKAIQDRSKLKQVSKNASDLVMDQYNLQEISEQYLELFKATTVVKHRNNKIDFSILPDYPHFPLVLTKVIRKFIRLLNLSTAK